MMSATKNVILAFRLVTAGLAVALCVSCNDTHTKPTAQPAPSVTFKPQEMADALHAVIAADREVYALHVVQRLQTEQHVIPVSENWNQDKALPLPAQMLRMASESVQKKGAEFHYVLRSLWPINPKNAPETTTEKAGLEFVTSHPEANYYTEESLGGRRYFTAVYPDRALSTACADCHNNHPGSTRREIKVGDVLGGVVVRIPLEF
jgi:cytochrome c553